MLFRSNRLVTQRVGALNDHFLARERPLAEARVLWEIGREGCEVRVLRARLELDSGHLSRLLRALEADGLIRVVPSPVDGRVRTCPVDAGRFGRTLRARPAQRQPCAVSFGTAQPRASAIAC